MQRDSSARETDQPRAYSRLPGSASTEAHARRTSVMTLRTRRIRESGEVSRHDHQFGVAHDLAHSAPRLRVAIHSPKEIIFIKRPGRRY